MTTATLILDPSTGERREFSRDYCGELAVINRTLEQQLAAVWPQMRRELDVLFAADLDELIRDAGSETREWPPFPDAPTETPPALEPAPDAATDVGDHAFDGDAMAAYMRADTPDDTMPGRVPGDGHPVLAQAYATAQQARQGWTPEKPQPWWRRGWTAAKGLVLRVVAKAEAALRAVGER